jgi:putative DNA primase/helicase
MNIESNFRDAMRTAGIPTEAPMVADGALHRIHVEGDRQATRNAWYVLHDGTHPAGAFGCNKRGISGKWRANSVSDTEFTRLDRALIEAHRKARTIEQERGYTLAADRARTHFNAANYDASEHPYCVGKGIDPFDARCNDNGDLVIPVFDARTMQLRSLQFIRTNGTKRFLPGGRMAYGCFPVRRSHESFKTALERRIGIAEGFATAATLAHVLGDSVAMFAAFSANNLQNVATALRQHYPNAEITIYGDHDVNEVGQSAAIKAATAVHGFVAIPSTPGADWNDTLRFSA